LTIVLEEALWLAARSGLPPTTLIRRAAADERRRQSAAQSRAVRRLEVLLVVPAGLCLLPAFVLLGVAPVVLDLVLG
jgi:tight adherence protein B